VSVFLGEVQTLKPSQKFMIPLDALQVLVLAHTKGAQAGDYPRIKDYFEEVRTAAPAS